MLKSLFFFFFLSFLTFFVFEKVGVYEKGIFSVGYFGDIAIESISLDEELCYFDRDFCLQEGVWLKYFDLEKGNFLLTGHNSFIYPLKAGVFFNLAEIEKGDEIKISYEGEIYTYEVEELFIVDKYDVKIEDFGNDKNILKLYTCYPNWSDFKRFVVEARRVID